MRIADQLTDLGIDSLVWPLMEIVPVVGEISIPIGTEALLFTSSHAVRRYGDLTARRDLPVFCVGRNTAEVARTLGLSLAESPAETASDLVDLVCKGHCRQFQYFRGQDISVDLSAALDACGCTVKELIVYAAEATKEVDSAAQAALSNGKVAAISVWSTRQGAILASFAKRNPEWSLENTDLVAISRKAALDLQETGFRRILVASRPEAEAMVQTISVAVRQKAD